MARSSKTSASTVMTAQAWARAHRQLEQLERALRQVKLPNHMRPKLEAAKLALEALAELVEVEVVAEFGTDWLPQGSATPVDLDPSKL